MILVEMFSWWYSAGITAFFAKLKHFFLVTSDFFSVNILLKTLFNPYRQIVGRATNSSPAGMFQALIDTLVSRFIGFLIRLITLVLGGIILILQILASIVAFVVWIILPITPLICVVLFFGGVA